MILNRSVTATAYIVNGQEVLLHEHKKYKTWFPVGGHLEPDEFPHEALMREIREETGLAVRLIPTETMPETDLGRVRRIPLPFCTCHEGIGHEEEFYDFIFIAETDERVPHPGADESRRFRWFSREALLADSSIKPHVLHTALAVLDYIGRH